MASLYKDGFDIVFHDAVFRIYSFRHCRIVSKTSAESADSNLIRAPDILHSHSYYEIHLITDGKATFLVENSAVSVSSGELIIMPLNCPHMSNIENASYTDTVLSLGLLNNSGHGREFFRYFRKRLDSLAKQPISLSEKTIRRMVNDSSIYGNSPEFLNIDETNMPPPMSIEEYCEQKIELGNLLMMLFRDIGLFQYNTGYSRTVEGERNVLLENLVYNITLPMNYIVRSLGYSVRYTSKIINEYYGECLTAVRGRIRFNSLHKILEENPDDTLETAGKKAGYTNVSALIRAVRKYAGCTPTEFRKQIEKEKTQIIDDENKQKNMF